MTDFPPYWGAITQTAISLLASYSHDAFILQPAQPPLQVTQISAISLGKCITAQKLVVFVMNLMGTNSPLTQAEIKIISNINSREYMYIK